MTVKKKFGISAIFATILLAAILSASIASAQENETTQENMTMELTFGPETLDKLKNDPYCVAAYGSIPAFTTSEERYQWINTLSNILDNLYNASFMQDQENLKYFDPFGPIKTSGVTFDGVIEISVNNSSKVDKPLLDEFYQLIDTKASSIGVKEVPVVFMREEDLPLDDLEPPSSTENLDDLEPPSSMENDENSVNDSISNTSDSNGNKSSKVNSTPGFELLGSLVCLYGGWKLRKK